MEKQRNAVNAFTKECIATALIKLMKEKKYEDITITDIAKKAGVSRVTYYRNYNSKDEIITQHMDELGYQFKQEIKHLKPKDKYTFLVAFFHYWIKRSDFLLHLYQANLQYVLLEHLNKSISTFAKNTREKYEASCYLGLMHNILFEWVQGGFKESPNEMAAIICNLIEKPARLPLPK